MPMAPASGGATPYDAARELFPGLRGGDPRMRRPGGGAMIRLDRLVTWRKGDQCRAERREDTMDKIIVHVYVPQSVAVREGKTVYGSVEIVPTEEQWRELAREQREWLATRGALKPSTVSNGLIELASTETDWAHVFARIVELFVADEAKRAQEGADRESRILQLLARTDEEWITTGLEVSPVAVFTPRFTRPYGVDDPRIDAVEERLRPEIMRRRDDVIAAARAAREKIEREDAEREAAIAAKVSEAEREITAWAIENGGLELSRAAREGYEIAGAGMDDVAARVGGMRGRAPA